MGWITDRLAEMAAEKQQALPRPSIPQAPPEPDTSAAGLVEMAKASVAKLRPAASVAERFGAEPGEGIGTPARRHAQPSVRLMHWAR